jgi:hypothetical protein
MHTVISYFFSACACERLSVDVSVSVSMRAQHACKI